MRSRWQLISRAIIPASNVQISGHCWNEITGQTGSSTGCCWFARWQLFGDFIHIFEFSFSLCGDDHEHTLVVRHLASPTVQPADSSKRWQSDQLTVPRADNGLASCNNDRVRLVAAFHYANDGYWDGFINKVFVCDPILIIIIIITTDLTLAGN